MSFPRCRLCSTELRHTFVDLGMSPPCESYLQPTQLDARRDVLPAACPDLRELPAGPAARVHPAGGHLLRLRVLLLLLRLLGGARPPVRRGGSPHPAARTWTPSWSRWRATTATCCSTASRGASARWASSRRPTSPRWPRAKGIDTEVAFLGEQVGQGRRRAARARPTWWWRTTSSPTCPTSSTSARDCARWSPTTARSASRSRTCSG